MKISLDWLSDFVAWKETDPETIAERLTLSTAEVEHVTRQGEFLDHCCIGKVVQLTRHPNADRLMLADVETDKGMKRVVCGGSNLLEGMLVAFAHVGARVRWHGTEVMTLTPTKIRGKQSEGMICSADELDLLEMFPKENEHEIIDIAKCQMPNAKLQAGAPLREAFDLQDTILDINNTAITMRPDLFSHLGVARECVALGIAAWKKTPEDFLSYLEKSSAKFFTTIPVPFKVKVECKEVPYYEGCLLEIDGIGETPDWMVRRLAATGWRSVSLPVDITNYVTMELGMPLHSFDADDFHGDVRIRKAHDGERVTTLDTVDRRLPEGAVVLSDDEGIFDLLGIMGGLRSSTKEHTKRIYLHAAVIDPAAIRRAIVATGHRTDASTIYEKGIPHSTASIGFLRAFELLRELTPGCRSASRRETYGKPWKPAILSIKSSRISSLIGTEIPEKTVLKILKDLGYGVKKIVSKLAVTSPLHRQRDVKADVDVIEDIARIYGYDRIPEAKPVAPLHLPARESRANAIRDALREAGYCELLPLSFVSPQLVRRAELDPLHARKVQNPIGEETSLLQSTSIPRLLEQAEQQVRQTAGMLRTFTAGRVFLPKGGERWELGLLLASKHATTLADDPFLLLKRDLAAALCRVGHALGIQSGAGIPPAYAHPGRAAAIVVDGETMGMLCEIHPTVRERFGLPTRVAIATFDLGELLTHQAKTFTIHPAPRYPAVTYDLTVPHTRNGSAADLIKKISTSHSLIEAVEIADIYGDGDDCRLTLRCTYRSPERTLTEEEVKKTHAEVERLASVE